MPNTSPPSSPALPSANTGKITREERLAAKLRENLRRRKSQAREIGSIDEETLPKTGGQS